MPQDGLRSALYRSFVTCDDPKGVVTCRTIRKSKAHKMENNRQREIGNRKMKSGLSASLDYHHSLESEDTAVMASSREEIHSPASFQLMEVSRGAQKLNRVIECWSKGVAFGGQPKDIAKDLLKGAIDLQDSLVMLGKLQEASRYMARLKRQQTMERSGRGSDNYEDGGEDWSVGRVDSDQASGFRKGRLSIDGCGNRYPSEELKKAIRESLVKQNLVLPKKCREVPERACFGQVILDSASTSESPTTASSSQSSLMAPAFTDSPTASGSVAPQAARGPNLIAKLMGLEEYPSRPLQATPEKQFEGHKVRGRRIPVFDIDMPRVRRPQHAAPKVDPERRSLKEILESMQFKGLLRSNSSEGLRPLLDHRPHNAASRSKQKLIDDGPPIVLIKPLRVPCLEPKETCRSMVEEEDPLYRRKMLRKLRRTEELQPKAIVSYREEALKSDKRFRKPDAEVTRSEGLKPEGTQEQRVIVEVPEEKDVVVKVTASVKSKVSRPVNHRQQRNEGVEKRAEKIPKVTTVIKKSLEKDVKRRNVPKSEDQAKRILVKARKPDSESNIANNQNSRQPSTKPSAIKHTDHSAARNSPFQKKNYMKKEKPAKKPASPKSAETSRCEEQEKKIELSSESDYHEVMIDTTGTELAIIEDQLPNEDGTDTSESKIEERCGNGQSSPCEATPSTPCINGEKHDEFTEEAPIDMNLCKTADSKTFKTEASPRALLMSSLSFQNCAEELFNLNINDSSILQASPMDGFGESSVKLFLDCANELIERKSFLDSQTAHPLLPTCEGTLRRCVSLEMLVEEVCNGIEALRNYTKLAGGNLSMDFLYAMLERDITSGGAVNGIWDSGWRTGFSWVEAEQVVNDIEKLVFSGLIEEVFA